MASRGRQKRRSRKRRRSGARGGTTHRGKVAPPKGRGPEAGGSDAVAAASGAPAGAPGTGARRYSRSEARNAEARAKLVPLREGERPRAVTAGALLACISALANMAYALGIGVEAPGQRVGPVVFSVLMLVVAWGMWRVRYWAVLGMQALLALSIVSLALFVLIEATPLQAALLVVLALLPLGALFWLLVKAMARIQMPERR